MAAEALVIKLIEELGSVVASEVVKPVCSFLVREAFPSAEIHSQISSIKREFELMSSYLRDQVDRREDGNELVETWARMLQDLLYQVEDIVDEYTYLKGVQQRSGFYASLHQASSYYRNFKSWHSIRSQLQDVNTRIVNLASQKERYGIKDEGTSTQGSTERHRHHQGYSSFFVDEEETVGFEEHRDILIRWLTRDEQQRRTITSIWGMGGSGKTTLAMDVYRSQETRRHFHCRAWVFVSSSYTTDQLLRKIAEQLFEENDEIPPHDINTMSLGRVVDTIRNFLEGKRYLIVLDDVWDANAWFEISAALVDGSCGSRIVITTRIRSVAMLAFEGRVIELLPLSESDSWLLFRKRAFWKDEGRTCPRELEYWGRKITDRCRGLPLAIVAIGRVASLRERTELEWRKLYEGLSWGTANDNMSDRVKVILNYSFKDLPYYLRNCFLYCSIFPEDYPIKRKRLIRLWVAEGFVEKCGKGRSTMEEVAEGYIDDLVHRCMLQVSKRNHFGRVKLCRMHDVVRELTLSVCQRENFCRIYNDEEDDSIGEARRVSVQKGSGAFQSRRGFSQTRSFFLFDTYNLPLLKSVSASFRLLKVLDLEGAPIESVPKAVTGLFNLRYLGLRKTKVRELPRSIGRLRNLETLDLYDSGIERLPRGVTKLLKLRHLFVESVQDPTFAELGSDPGVSSPRGLWNLTNLRTLQSTQANEEMVRKMVGMTQLRTLRITKVRGTHCTNLCHSLTKMRYLVNLDIAATDETEILRLEELEQIACNVKKLEIRARLDGVLPVWFNSLTSLRQLGLSWSGLREDPLPCLGALPHLAVLGLYRAYDGEKLCFKAGGFPKLNMLMLGGSTRLDAVDIEDGAMPRLSELCLLRCSGLRLLPEGIEHLTTLQVMSLLEMPEEFVRRLHRDSRNSADEDLKKVGHIPVIKHVFQQEGRWVSEILS